MSTKIIVSYRRFASHLLDKKLHILSLFEIKLHAAFSSQNGCDMDGGHNLTHHIFSWCV